MADVIKYPTSDESRMSVQRTLNSLELDCYKLESHIEELCEHLHSFGKGFTGIVDVEDFKYRLRQDNLLTPELEDFIECYMRHRNKEILKELIPDEY